MDSEIFDQEVEILDEKLYDFLAEDFKDRVSLGKRSIIHFTVLLGSVIDLAVVMRFKKDEMIRIINQFYDEALQEENEEEAMKTKQEDQKTPLL
jgi:hypothetical protein